MLNHVVITGNIVRDLELRQAGENTVLNFTIACTRSYVPKGGDRITDFINVTAWGKNAETIAKNFSKGQPITVIGELHIDQYEKDGVRRSSPVVHMNSFEFVPQTRGDNTNGGGNQTAYKTLVPRQGMTPVEASEDDLPF